MTALPKIGSQLSHNLAQMTVDSRQGRRPGSSHVASWRNGGGRLHLSASLMFFVLMGWVFLGSGGQAMAAGPIIAAGNSFALATASNGKLYAWGKSGWGALGDGPTDNHWAAVRLPSGVRPTAVAAGERHCLAIGSDGKLYAWGFNASGELGNGTRNESSIPLVVSLSVGVMPKAVAAGGEHSLAIGSNGTLYAWGQNNAGQLGNGTTKDSWTPVEVSLPAGVTPRAIAAGWGHSLAIGSNGKLYAWGQNNAGQLGNGTTKDSSVPVVVSLPSGVTPTAIAAGGEHSLAIGNDGNLYAWGKNNDGQLGNGTTKDSSIPMVVKLPAGAMPMAVSAGVHFNLAIGSDGKLYSWGANGLDQLGSGTPVRNSSTPVVVRLPSGVTPKVTAGGLVFGLAVGSDGKFYAWGSGSAVDPVNGAEGHTFDAAPVVLSFMSHASQVVLPAHVPQNIPLAQTAKPITRAYPGVDASVLGIRTGMTVSQVEAMAAQRGLGKPDESATEVSVSLDHFFALSGEKLQVSSKAYVYRVGFGRTGNSTVEVSFSSPATGNRSDAIALHTSYPPNPNGDPLTVTALATKLLHKYGPPSFEIHGKDAGGGWYLWWDFTKQSLLQTCNKTIPCFPYPGEFDFSSILASDAHRPKQIHPDFYIVAWVRPNSSDRGKAGQLDLSMGDVQFATLDRGAALQQATRQLKITAESNIVDAPEIAASKKQKRWQEERKLVPKF
jgi:alpha-tubulin suppressor-like RCC1 family protein